MRGNVMLRLRSARSLFSWFRVYRGTPNTKPIYGGGEVLMQSLTFTPGEAFLASDSPTVPWTVVFEDEGVTGYFYACDRSQQGHDQSILDAMSIYSVSALAASDARLARPTAERIATVVWSRDGLKAVL